MRSLKNYKKFIVGIFAAIVFFVLPSEPVLAAQKLFIVIVNSDLQPLIQSSLNQYKSDLEYEGYTVEIKPWSLSGSSASQLKEYLRSRLGDGLYGTFFVGDLPYMNSVYNGYAGPCDQYFTSFNTPFITMTNGAIDYVLGGGWPKPEIIIGRLTASRMTIFDGQYEEDLINNYFRKLHLYRTGELLFPERALNGSVSINDYNGACANSPYMQVSCYAYNEYVQSTTKDKITDKLTHERLVDFMRAGTEYIFFNAHSAVSYALTESGPLVSTDFVNTNPLKTGFYYFYNCEAGEWNNSDSLANSSVLAADSGLNALAYASVTYSGQDYAQILYFQRLGANEAIGEALKNNYLYDANAIEWWHVVILGDPTLKLHRISAPTNLVVSAGNGKNTLNWSVNPETETLGYNIYRSLTAGGPYSKVNTTLLTTTTYEDTGLINGTHFFYTLTAVNSCQPPRNVQGAMPAPFSSESMYSAEKSGVPVLVADLTAPGIVTGLTALNVSGTDANIYLSWNPNGEADLAGYNLYRTVQPDASGLLKINASLLAGASFTDTTAVAGINYYYVVKAVDFSGNESGNSSISAVAPSDLKAPVVSHISHTNPYNTYTEIINWKTDENADGRVDYGTTLSYGKSASEASYTQSHSVTLTSLLASALYYYRVVSKDTNGNAVTAFYNLAAANSGFSLKYPVVDGYVYTPGGAKQTGVLVEFTQGGTTLGSCTSDSNGYYLVYLNQVGGGVYNVRATGSGFTTVNLNNLTILGDKIIDINPPANADVTPPAGTIAINSGASYTNESVVALTLSASDSESGMGRGARMIFSNDNINWTEDEGYSTSKLWALSSGSGSKTVYVKYCDAAGRWTAAISANINLDQTAPTGSVTVNSGVASVSETTVTLNLNYSDAGTCAAMQFSNDGYTWTGFENYAATKVWSLTAGNGTKNIYLKVRDMAGNSVTGSVSVVLAGVGDVTPPTGALVINGNALYTNLANVTLTLSAADASGVSQMAFSNDNASWSAPEAYAVSKIFTLSQGDGVKTVYAKFKDNAGNWTTALITGSIRLDQTVPVFSLQQSALCTNSSALTLKLAASDEASGVSFIKYCEDGSNWTAPEIYSTEKVRSLSMPEGAKYIAVKVGDGAGNWSNTTTVTVAYDLTPPVNCSFIVNEGAATTSSIYFTIANSQSISDPVSGLGNMWVSTDGILYRDYGVFAANFVGSYYSYQEAGTKTIYVKYADKAGNQAAPVSRSFYYTPDLTPPSGYFTINGGALYTAVRTVTINNYFTDAASGIPSGFWDFCLRISNEAEGYSGARYSDNYIWDLSAIEGVKRVNVMVSDKPGNWTSPTTVTIIYDVAAPTGTLTINNGAVSTNNQTVKLGFSASDAAGVSKVRVSNDGTNWNAWEDFVSEKSWSLTAGDGAKTVFVQYRDLGQNTSPVYSANILLNASGNDIEAPVVSFKINNAALTTNTQTVTLSITALDKSGVSEMRFSNDGVTYSAAEPFTVLKAWTVLALDGVKNVYAQFKDGVGNWNSGNSITASILLDQTGPTGFISNRAYVNTASVVLSLSGITDAYGVAYMKFSNDGVNWSATEVFASTKTWYFSNTEGLKTIYAKFQDAYGNWSNVITTTTTADFTVPTGTLTLNGGAPTTNVRYVYASLNGDDPQSLDKMQFADGYLASALQPYSTAQVQFPFCTTADGAAPIIGMLVDKAGNLSSDKDPNLCKTILYDSTPPFATLSINNGALFTATGTVTLSIFASDLSGTATMQFSNEYGAYSSWEAFSGTKVWTLSAGSGIKTVNVKLTDNASNVSNAYSVSIIYNTALPTGTLAINGGAPATSLTTVTLQLSATDAGGTGITQMKFSNDGTNWSVAENYSSSKLWSLSSGDGAKTIYVKYKSGAGIWSANVTSSITLSTGGGDTTPPTGSIVINGGAVNTMSVLVTLSLSAVDASGVAQMKFSSDGSTWTTPETYTSEKVLALNGSDGNKTVYAMFKDGAAAANWSSVYSAGIIFDTKAPAGYFTVNNGALYTNLVNVTINNFFTDTATGVVSMKFSNDGINWSVAENYAASKTWTLDAVEGARTVYGKFCDGIGNWTNALPVTIGYDIPLSATISLIWGYTSGAGTAITVSMAATSGSVITSSYSNDGNFWINSAYSSYSGWTLSGGDGLKTVYGKFLSRSGVWSSVVSATTTLDSTAPFGSISINGGASITPSTTVTLTLNASDAGGSGVSLMQFSNDGVTYSTLEAYSSSKVWDLTAGSGAKTVYVRFKDAVNNISQVYSSVITVGGAGIPAPVVSGLSVASLSNTTSSIITITGSGFYAGGAASDVLIIRLNTAPTSTTLIGWTCISDGEIRNVNLPAGIKTGTYDVLVTTTGGTNVSSLVKLVVTTTVPSVISLNPADVNYGNATVLSIQGSGFNGGASVSDVSSVKLYSNPVITFAGYSVVNDTLITGVSIPGSVKAGTYALKVANSAGESAGVNFVVVSPIPVVSGVSPSTAYRHVTNTLTLSGSGYFGGLEVNSVTAVKLNGPSIVTISSYSVTADNAISNVIVPSGILEGTYDVLVTSNGRTNVLSTPKYVAIINGTAPKISSALANATTLNIAYDSNMDVVSVTDKNNYTVESPVGTVLADKSGWTLTYINRVVSLSGPAFVTTFKITASGVKNDAQNSIVVNGTDNVASGAVDATAPTGSVVINAGAAYTLGTSVTLAISSTEGGGGSKNAFK